MTTDIVVSDTGAPVTLARRPEDVLEQASAAARALTRVIEAGGGAHVATIQGRRYLRLEAWTTLAVLHGLTAEVEWTRRVTEPDGWEARAVVRRGDIVVSAAEAQCTRDEPSWRDRPEYALRSMAQTRALSKALRLALSWIVVLAGYEATPAEEVPEAEAQAAPAPPQPKAGPPRPTSSSSSSVDWRGWRPEERRQLVDAMREAGMKARDLVELVCDEVQVALVEQSPSSWPQAVLGARAQMGGMEPLLDAIRGWGEARRMAEEG